MRRWLAELAALPMLPLLIAQGKHTRRITPRLPEAAGATSGVAGTAYSSSPLRLLAVGESPVAGVGVASHEQAITGQFAQLLSLALQRPVTWQACGKNGVTVGQALQQILPHIPHAPVDILLVAFGVNDSTAFHSVARWESDLCALLAALEARCNPGMVLLAGVPPLQEFPALPQPLRWVMGLKGRALDAATQRIALGSRCMRHVSFLLAPSDPGMMAEDGYHPSAAGCRAWAGILLEACCAEGNVRFAQFAHAAART